MRLDVYRALWGYPAAAPQAVIEIAEAGYDGVEAVLPEDIREREELVGAVGEAGVAFIPLIAVDGETVADQLSDFKRNIEAVESLGVPLSVMHTGRDFWDLTDAVSFYESVVGIEAEFEVTVAHETHRGRPLFTPWATSAILADVPDLALCCDFSHWVVVAERFLADQEAAIALAASRCEHVHARIGTDQAPQVSDPSDPRNDSARAAFERWWGQVWDAQEARGREVATATPELGPPPYQPLHSSQDDAEIELRAACDWQASRLRELFADRASTV
jgi:hypothetical protein